MSASSEPKSTIHQSPSHHKCAVTALKASSRRRRRHKVCWISAQMDKPAPKPDVLSTLRVDITNRSHSPWSVPPGPTFAVMKCVSPPRLPSGSLGKTFGPENSGSASQLTQVANVQFAPVQYRIRVHSYIATPWENDTCWSSYVSTLTRRPRSHFLFPNGARTLDSAPRHKSFAGAFPETITSCGGVDRQVRKRDILCGSTRV